MRGRRGGIRELEQAWMMGIGVGLIGDRGGDILSIVSNYNTNGLTLRQGKYLRLLHSNDKINGLTFRHGLCWFKVSIRVNMIL